MNDRPTSATDREPAHVPRALAAAAVYGWRIVVVAGAVFVIAWVLTQLYVVVVPLVLSLFIASALEPAVDRLRRWGVPSTVAAVLAFAVVGAILVLGGWWLSAQVRGQFDDLGAQARQGLRQVEQWLTNGPLNLDSARVDRLEDQLTSVQATGGGLTQRIAGRARQLLEVLAGAVLIVFATFFLLKDGPAMGRWITDRVGPPYREDLAVISTRAQRVMRWYLVGTAGVGLADASLLAIVLIVLGVPLVLPLTLLTFAAAFFPIVGAVVAGAVAALVALVAGGFQTALLVVVATILIQQIEGNLLQPLIMGRAVSLHPLVTLSAVSAGLIIAGLIGAFLAVPLTALTAQVAGHYHRKRSRAGPLTADRTHG